jgi:monothiol glutaredoxin
VGGAQKRKKAAALPIRNADNIDKTGARQRAVAGAEICAQTGYNSAPFQATSVRDRMDILDVIKDQIDSNPIILYMKGSPNQPQCGFSARTSQALMACGERFAYVDVLSNPDIRASLPGFANWPTFPQLWVEGELVGGCDIVVEMYESGELQPLLKEAAARTQEAVADEG